MREPTEQEIDRAILAIESISYSLKKISESLQKISDDLEWGVLMDHGNDEDVEH
tara:strand:- start:1324 stop:1485 length:162 start_codon:yes stop_codon:yes gene_type:complete